MQTNDLTLKINTVITRLPEWVRTDLTAKDIQARSRAEETLAAMIVAAINGDHHGSTPPAIDG
jgi:hypothetical protein